MEGNRKKILAVAVPFVLILLVITAAFAWRIIDKYTPTKERTDLNEYYNMSGENDVALFLNNEMMESRAALFDGKIYVDIDDVTEHFNERFYWDSYENLLIYTTPSDIIKVSAGSSSYYITKQEYDTDYTIVRIEGTNVYVALDFISQYTDMIYEYFDTPSRLYIYNEYTERIMTQVTKTTVVREKGGIKSPIVADTVKGSVVTVLEELEDWSKVLTDDGYIGYIRNKYIGDTYIEEAMESSYVEPEYVGISKNYDISLVFHQVGNADANKGIWNLMDNTKGVNTICPTWFAVSDTDGNIRSFADADYVNTAHNLGYEVWGLVSNLEIEVDMYAVLAHTTSRENLENQLVAQAIQYNLDGINVDLESISSDTAEAYIQFIRELSIKCHNNGIVVSIDNYVPTESSAFYNRKEQGIVADYIIIMGYDEHWGGGGESGSVASIGFVRDGITNTLLEVPKEKVINAIPFYTRLWVESTDEAGNVTVTSTTYNMQNASALIYEKSPYVQWNEECGQYYGAYEDEEGNVYKMWLEDERSIEEKMKAISENDLAGVACWKLGLETEEVWDVITQYINN